MKKPTAFIASLVLYSLLLQSSLFAAGYIKIGDIKGEAIDKSNASEVQSVRWMAPENLNSRARGGGTVSITKPVDKSSPLLAKSQSTGSVIETMAVADGGKQYLLKNVKVVSVVKRGKQEVVNLRFQHRQEFGPTRKAAAANHNTTRSNRTQSAAAGAPAQDYNSSRSNSSKGAAPAEGGDYNSSRSNKTHTKDE